LQQAPNLEAYYQILALQTSKCNWPKNYILPCSSAFSCPQLKINYCFKTPDGIAGIVVTAIDKDSPILPLIVFRGTDPSNIRNVIDDLNLEIGSRNCKEYKHGLKILIETVSAESGKRIHIMGHSYGGAI